MSDIRPRLPQHLSKHLGKLKNLTEQEAARLFGEATALTGYKKYMVAPDWHSPYENKPLTDRVINLISNMHLDGFVISGDFLDLFALGSYNADSLGLLKGSWDLGEEYELGRNLFDRINQALPDSCTEKIWIFGNHEDRYFREKNKGDRAKYGSALMHPAEALQAYQKGWKVLENWMHDSYSLGDIDVVHGLSTCVNVAKKMLEDYGSSVIFGHTHRFQVYGAGKHIAYNIGWLGDGDNKAFGYMYKKHRVNKWMNGFAFVNVHPLTGEFWVEPIQCHNNQFFYGNTLY